MTMKTHEMQYILDILLTDELSSDFTELGFEVMQYFLSLSDYHFLTVTSDLILASHWDAHSFHMPSMSI